MQETMNVKAPQWYSTEEIQGAIHGGTFFRKGCTVEESIAKHLQAAFEKGFELGHRADPASENARLRKALLDRVMVWDDPSARDFKVCELCGNAEGDGHKAHCVLA